MSSASPIEITRRSVWSWVCSLSSALTAGAAALLAVHGWILGESAAISENTGPILFEIHLLVLGVLMLFATWLAAPTWLVLCLIPTLRQPRPALTLQAFVFGTGWLFIFGAMILIEVSPAGRAF